MSSPTSPQDDPALGASVANALEHLREGGVVAYPTETVWGLGVCADRRDAVDALRDWKGRREEAPLAVLVPRPASVGGLGCSVGRPARRLMEAFWPGPLMLVLPCEDRFAPGVARSDGALGVRCSPHPIALALAEALESEGLGPLTSTSLNRSGAPPALRLEEARALLTSEGAGVAPLLVSPGPYDAGGEAPSTVVDCTQANLGLLREGAIARPDVEAAAAEGPLGNANR